MRRALARALGRGVAARSPAAPPAPRPRRARHPSVGHRRADARRPSHRRPRAGRRGGRAGPRPRAQRRRSRTASTPTSATRASTPSTTTSTWPGTRSRSGSPAAPIVTFRATRTTPTLPARPGRRPHRRQRHARRRRPSASRAAARTSSSGTRARPTSATSSRLDYAGTPEPAPAPDHPQRLLHASASRSPTPARSGRCRSPTAPTPGTPSTTSPPTRRSTTSPSRAPAPWIGIANGQLTERTDRRRRHRPRRGSSTEPASSYLVTLAIGDYAHASNTSASGVPVDLLDPARHGPGARPTCASAAASIDWIEEQARPLPLRLPRPRRRRLAERAWRPRRWSRWATTTTSCRRR